MQVRELQRALKDIGSLLSASGAQRPSTAVADVLELLDGRLDQDLDQFLDQLQSELSPVVRLARSLKSAGTDEQAFLAAFQHLKDAGLSKDDLMAVAKGYTGSADTSASKVKLLKAISTQFYIQAYERDSRAMAKTATPW